MQTIQDGDKGEDYPFLWRVMRLGDCQRCLTKLVSDFDGVAVYYFLNFHTSPKAALHFRTYIDHSTCAPSALNIGEGAHNYILVGISCLQTASVFSRCRDITDASIALLKGK